MRRAMIWAGAVLAGAGVAPGGPSRRAEAQVAFQPNVGTIADGVGMTAVPSVSADRRYVRLSVGANFQAVDGFENVGIPFAASGLGSGTGAGAAAGALAGAGFPGAGGFRSVGVPMGMDGPVGGGGSGAGPGPGAPAMMPNEAYAGYAAADPAYAPDDASWAPAPRRPRASRARSTRARKPASAPTPGSAAPRPAAGDRVKP